ncbi:hypothetical protein O181_055043 [Austropuccinia psidii MF-1]|uniref:DUF4219 domain-containing protein n=1 Tax=Austropuccinia psidii MF-1 TaxID=1389203 RepID=A0A9Q3E770_9BASI|nr:hypothetical protein [Austropuccinia psidii MF-1]
MTDRLLEAKDSSNIPVLNGLNYSEWCQRIKIFLRSKELLDVCINKIDADANTAVQNKWEKISSDAISFISSKLVPLSLQKLLMRKLLMMRIYCGIKLMINMPLKPQRIEAEL